MGFGAGLVYMVYVRNLAQWLWKKPSWGEGEGCGQQSLVVGDLGDCPVLCRWPQVVLTSFVFIVQFSLVFLLLQPNLSSWCARYGFCNTYHMQITCALKTISSPPLLSPVGTRACAPL